MENIRYGKIDATDEEVMDAARKAHADKFISKMPEGYATLVGERGVKLSGGQRQAVSLIMATMQPSKILLLDEHTAALDPKMERLILELTHRLISEKK